MKKNVIGSCLFLSVLGLASTLLCSSVVLANEARPKPNVVLVLTDDLGWQDVKCYDVDDPSPIDTPHLDALAQKGVMFWQAYSPAPTCAPSRCAIISGIHPARAQKTHVIGGSPPYAKNSSTQMMDPWYSGRMPEDTFTLARALKGNGYVTGHMGKWHIAINHGAFPGPKDVGFDESISVRGAHSMKGMKDRLKGFATTNADDPFRLDENGFAYHENNENAIQFIRDNKGEPFFLYYCNWLVHSPIITRSEALLQKYAKRLGVDPRSKIGDQVNPFYCAMVESLDYYIGQLVEYLEKTEDPRRPGHMLIDNTYVIFTSDNGGSRGKSAERYTDNSPLDKGKSSAKEGGTRVPLLISGPGITKKVQSDVMVNGLDFYPTILSLTGTEKPQDKHLDGSDISALLLGDAKDSSLVKDADGSVRDTLVWHFPHGSAKQSTIRVGDFKLIRNYNHLNNEKVPEFELFQLYKTNGNVQERVDIEEAVNLANKMPEKTAVMNRTLTQVLTEMEASYPWYNPKNTELLGQDQVCRVLSHERAGNRVDFTFEENGAQVIRADLIYTLNGGEKYEEWFRAPAMIADGLRVSVDLPAGTTHYFLNLIDENHFLLSYPEIKSRKEGFVAYALVAD